MASVVAEAMLLAALGALIGAALVYLVLGGYSTSTFNDASGTQLGFAGRDAAATIPADRQRRRLAAPQRSSGLDIRKRS